MVARKSTNLERMATELRQYADLRAEQAKLKATDGLSKVLSQFFVIILIIALVFIILILLAVVAIQWLNGVIGDPWGSVIVCGFFLVMLLVLILGRKKFFRGMFEKLFSGAFGMSEERNLAENLTLVNDKIKTQELAINGTAKAIKKSLTPVSMVANFVGNTSKLFSWSNLALLASVFGKSRRGCKKK